MKTLLVLAAAAVLLAPASAFAQACPGCNKDKIEATFVSTQPAIQDKDKAAAKSIVETAAGVADFSTLVAAVKAAGLAEALSGGELTVFAPTNAAFEKLPEGTVEMLLKPENKEKLVAILKYHVVDGAVMAKDVLPTAEVSMLGGDTAALGLTIGGANIVKTDIKCSNGVIHVIDTVIMPPKK